MLSLYVFLAFFLVTITTGKPQWNPHGGCFYDNCPIVSRQYNIPHQPSQFPIMISPPLPQIPYYNPPVRQVPFNNNMAPIYPIPIHLQYKPIDTLNFFVHNHPSLQEPSPTTTATSVVSTSTTTTTERATSSTAGTTPAPTRQAYLCPDPSLSPCRIRRQVNPFPDQPIACASNSDCSSISISETILCCEDPCLQHNVCKPADVKFV